MKKNIKLWLPVVLIISFVFIYFMFLSAGKIESLTIYTYGDESDTSKLITVNYKKGEITGGIPLIKLDQRELNQYFDYVNDVLPKIKRKSYMSGQSFSALIWRIDVVYS